MNSSGTLAVIVTNNYMYYSKLVNNIWQPWIQTLDTTVRDYVDVKLSANGSQGVAVAYVKGGNQDGLRFVYYFKWNNDNFSELTQINDSVPRSYTAITLSSDGSILFACSSNEWRSPTGIFYSIWNSGTGNFNQLTLVPKTNIFSKWYTSIDVSTNMIVYSYNMAVGGGFTEFIKLNIEFIIYRIYMRIYFCWKKFTFLSFI
jgi:hypothetical protein